MYFAGEDLLGCKMILTACQVSEMQFAPSGRISAAKMALNFQQTEEVRKKRKSGLDLDPETAAAVKKVLVTTVAATAIISSGIAVVANVIACAKTLLSPFKK
jgi:hypothetical protein